MLADLSGVDAVITDIPYDKGFLPVLPALAAWADKVLTPKGVLVVLSGETYLDQVYELLSGHRPYRWTGCLLGRGPGYNSFARDVQSRWKPVLVYGRGPRITHDVFRCEGSDTAAKEDHGWAQDLGAFCSIIDASDSSSTGRVRSVDRFRDDVGRRTRPRSPRNRLRHQCRGGCDGTTAG